MATLVARRRKDGTLAHRVQWRLGGSGPWQSETFDDKRAAAKFQGQVEAHGHMWPEGWVKGWGYGASPALDDESAGDLLLDFATAYVRRLTSAGPDTQTRYLNQVKALVGWLADVKGVEPTLQNRAQSRCPQLRCRARFRQARSQAVTVDRPGLLDRVGEDWNTGAVAVMSKEAERAELHKTIWRIANDLRGSVDGWDFKSYVLGMLFYRFISENLTAYLNEQERAAGSPNFDYAKLSDTDAEFGRSSTVEEKGFYILPSDLFGNVRERARHDQDLNETLAKVFANIEASALGTASEDDFKGLFDDLDVNSTKLGPTVAKRNERVVKLLDAIGDLKLGHNGNTIDAFGDAYEYLMTMYASSAGKSGGEFFTPQEVSELLARIAVVGRTEVNKVYDPACGSGSLLLKFAKVLGKDNVRQGFFGQEVNFAGNEILTDRDFQDYQSVYLDLYADFRRLAAVERESINDDVIFEIELIKQIEVNVDYILALVQKYVHEHGPSHDKEIRAAISRAIDSSPSLRNKKDLIEQFVDSLNVDADIDDSWRAYVEAKRTEELDRIISEESLKPDATWAFVDNAFRDGAIPSTGTAIIKILPPVSRFSAGNAHALKKQTALERLTQFFDRFFGLT